MKPKILILTPVYNDWENLIKLLNKINKIFIKEIKSRFDLIVVDDFSNEKIHYENLKLKSINKLKIIKLHKNHGSQRALAIGLKFIKEFYSKNYRVIVIDSDGQDNPKGIIEMFKKIKINSNYSIVVKRGQRKEPIWFKIFYEIYCLIITFLSFKRMRHGNFSSLSKNDVNKIVKDYNLWNAFPPTLSNNIKNLKYITLDREKRFSGNSKMNFLGLILHALKVFSVLRLEILISSIIYIFLSYLVFFEKNIIFFIMISLFLILINLINFGLSFSTKKKFLFSYKKIEIL
tara:strand:- start:163 stop:1029 length:867 start_codon:yes stop_codon:yes gene_type:complete